MCFIWARGRRSVGSQRSARPARKKAQRERWWGEAEAEGEGRKAAWITTLPTGLRCLAANYLSSKIPHHAAPSKQGSARGGETAPTGADTVWSSKTKSLFLPHVFLVHVKPTTKAWLRDGHFVRIIYGRMLLEAQQGGFLLSFHVLLRDLSGKNWEQRWCLNKTHWSCLTSKDGKNEAAI